VAGEFDCLHIRLVASPPQNDGESPPRSCRRSGCASGGKPDPCRRGCFCKRGRYVGHGRFPVPRHETRHLQ
jgi:hypothetical protein